MIQYLKVSVRCALYICPDRLILLVHFYRAPVCQPPIAPACFLSPAGQQCSEAALLLVNLVSY
jgi:hypothetical protein